MKRQENRTVIVCRGAANTALVSSADRAYMKPHVSSHTVGSLDTLPLPMNPTIKTAHNEKSNTPTADENLIAEHFTGFVEKVNAVSKGRSINAWLSV